jgi:hypothetical protein
MKGKRGNRVNRLMYKPPSQNEIENENEIVESIGKIES